MERVLATIGGLFSVFVAVFGIIAVAYNEKAYKMQIANELYDFVIPEENDSKTDNAFSKQKIRWCDLFSMLKGKAKRSCKTLFIKSPQSKLRYFSSQPKQSGLESFFQKHKSYQRRKREKLQLTFTDFLLGPIFCWRRKKDHLWKKASTKVSSDIDIIQIVRKLQELEKLKKILFDKEQLDLISYTKNPLISIDLDEKRINSLQKLKKHSQKTLRVSSKHCDLTNIQSSLNLMDDSQYKEVADAVNLYESYKRIMRDKMCNYNDRILELVDHTMLDTLYHLNFELTQNPLSRKEYFQHFAIKKLFDLMINVREKQTGQMDHYRAMKIIGIEIKKYLAKKKAEILQPEAIDLPAKKSRIKPMRHQGKQVEDQRLLINSESSKQKISTSLTGSNNITDSDPEKMTISTIKTGDSKKREKSSLSLSVPKNRETGTGNDATACNDSAINLLKSENEDLILLDRQKNEKFLKQFHLNPGSENLANLEEKDSKQINGRPSDSNSRPHLPEDLTFEKFIEQQQQHQLPNNTNSMF